jgi:hypothetical protein
MREGPDFTDIAVLRGDMAKSVTIPTSVQYAEYDSGIIGNDQ